MLTSFTNYEGSLTIITYRSLLAASAANLIRLRRRRRAALVGRVWSRNWLLLRTSDRGMHSLVVNKLMVPDAGVS